MRGWSDVGSNNVHGLQELSRRWTFVFGLIVRKVDLTG